MVTDTASFRDPAGRVVNQEGKILRLIYNGHRNHYDYLMSCGLYSKLTKNRLLVTHSEDVDTDLNQFQDRGNIYKIICPEKVPYLNYPGEWTFGQLKDAALTTLKIQQEAILYGMILKDASAYNIQFIGFRPVFIDTLSFEILEEGTPWHAYKQFCEHFLCPLLLISKVDAGLQKLLHTSLEGIGLKTTSRILPLSAKFDLGVFMHVVLHAESQQKYEARKISLTNKRFNKDYHLYLVKSLTKSIEKLTWKQSTEWKDYYQNDVDAAYDVEKKKHLADWFSKIAPNTLWDLGANNGQYSRLASQMGILARSFDHDMGAVEANYQLVKKNRDELLLPILSDFTNTTPSFGWALEERKSFLQREKPDAVIALGLLHHLVISAGIPFNKVASFLHSFSTHLLIEFIPADDEKVKRLLQNRSNFSYDYSEDAFLSDFTHYFSVIEKLTVQNSLRVLYHLRAID